MYLFLVRHAQSANNKQYFDLGQSDEGREADPALSKLGEKQAARLAKYLGKARNTVSKSPYNWMNYDRIQPTHLYTSLMTRAILTARSVADHLDLPLNGLDYVHECGGVWLEDVNTKERIGQPGKNRAELQKLTPRLSVSLTHEKGWWGQPHETSDQWRERARRFVNFAITGHKMDDSVMLFSHAQFIGEIISSIFGVKDPDEVRFHCGNTSITRLRWNGEHWAMQYQNRVSHLSPRYLS